ncbi:TPA: hypothetical protein WHS78_001152 [Neisseria meningitidis]
MKEDSYNNDDFLTDKKKALKFESYFGKIIDKIIKEDSYNNDDFLTDKKKALIYSVLIYENFNRGLVYRYFEKNYFVLVE